MNEYPPPIGYLTEQARFSEEYGPWLERYSRIDKVANKIFARTVLDAADGEAETQQHVGERRTADLTVFYLGLIASDDLKEMLVLAANGMGTGALKILRGMYERVVYAAYVDQDDRRATPFLQDGAIRKLALSKRLAAVGVDILANVSESDKKRLEDAAAEAQAKRKNSICKKCKQPIIQSEWTNVSLADMAAQVDHNLGILYAACYVEPSAHHHATSFGLEYRLVGNDDLGYRYKGVVDWPAVRKALSMGEILIIQLLDLQNKRFNLGLQTEINECTQALRERSK